jgi:hypothetical protein
VRSRFERERDEAVRRKKEEEERAALAYRELLRDMEGEEEVREKKKQVGFVRAGGE